MRRRGNQWRQGVEGHRARRSGGVSGETGIAPMRRSQCDPKGFWDNESLSLDKEGYALLAADRRRHGKVYVVRTVIARSWHAEIDLGQPGYKSRSEEHTSELQSLRHL